MKRIIALIGIFLLTTSLAFADDLAQRFPSGTPMKVFTPGFPPDLGDLGDVNTAGAVTNDTLIYNSTTSQWNNGSIASIETDPKSLHIDQTVPQNVINGAPRFQQGLSADTTSIVDAISINYLNDWIDINAPTYHEDNVEIGYNTPAGSSLNIFGEGSLSSIYSGNTGNDSRFASGVYTTLGGGGMTGKPYAFFQTSYNGTGELLPISFFIDSGPSAIRAWTINTLGDFVSGVNGEGTKGITTKGFVTADSVTIMETVGTDKMTLTHDGTAGLIEANSGDIYLRSPNDIVADLQDSAGATNFLVEDGGNNTVWAVDSDGMVKFRVNGVGADYIYAMNNTTTAAIPSEDGFKLRWRNQGVGAGPNNDALMIEKTDANDLDPDGSIQFIMTGSDGVQEVVMQATSAGVTAETMTITSTASIPALSNLPTNGFVTTSGGTGTLGIDTNTYITSATGASSFWKTSGAQGSVSSSQSGTFSLNTTGPVTADTASITTAVGIGTAPSGYKLDILGADNSPVKIKGSAGGGLIMGAYDLNWGGIWSSGVVPAANNYALTAHPTSGTSLNAVGGGTVYLSIGDTDYARLTSAGNFGVTRNQYLFGGTATTNNLNLRANDADTTTGSVKVLTTTSSTSPTTGSLRVAGGEGIEENLWVGGTINGTNVTSGTDPGHTHTSGSITDVWKASGAQGSVSSNQSGTFSLQTSGPVTADTATITTSASIPRLSNLNTDGFVKTSGSNGTLGVDANSYLTVPAASLTYVPYTGANANVDLGSHDIAFYSGDVAENLNVTGDLIVSDITVVPGNLAINGTLTVTSDTVFMTTNTAGAVLVADGTDFSPMVMGGDATINGAGSVTVVDDSHAHTASTITEADPLSWHLTGVQTGITGDKAGTFSLSTTNKITADTAVITPSIIGGTATTSDLNLQTTSATGIAGADMHFKVGDNGGTEAMTILNNGFVGIGDNSPSAALDVAGGNIQLQAGGVLYVPAIGKIGAEGIIIMDKIYPNDSVTDSGRTTNRWQYVYAINGNFSNGVTADTAQITTSASIPKLSNLGTNGFVKTGSGDGTLSVDTNTYLTSMSGSSEYWHTTGAQSGIASNQSGSFSLETTGPVTADSVVITSDDFTVVSNIVDFNDCSLGDALTFNPGTNTWSGTTVVDTEEDPVVGAINGIVKADGAGNISAAVAGVDYVSSVSGYVPYSGATSTVALGSQILTTTGAVLVGSLNATSTVTADTVKTSQVNSDNYQNYGGTESFIWSSPEWILSDQLEVNSTLHLNTGSITDTTKVIDFGDTNLTGNSLDATAVTADTATITGNILTTPRHIRATIIDPATAYTKSTTICLIPALDAAITVTKLDVTLDATTNEVAGDVKWADAFIGLGSAAVINDFDTTSGVRSDSTIASGAVASGKAIYLHFDSAPNAAIKLMNIDIQYNY